MSKKKWIWIGLGVVVAVLLLLAILKGGPGENRIEVEVEQVSIRTIIEEVSASGKIFPATEIEISSDVSGEIVSLNVEEGDSVKAGQVLVKIDPEAYLSAVARGEASLSTTRSQYQQAQAAISSAEANVQQAQAQYQSAEAAYKRNRELLEEGIISQAEFEQAESTYQTQKANLAAARANLKSAERQAEGARYGIESAQASVSELRTSLNRTTLIAPVDGIVSKLNVEEGERVVGTIQMTGTVLMKIANLNAMEVLAEVSEIDILRVSIGDTAKIEVDAYMDQTFKGIVTQIANTSTDAVSLTGGINTEQVTNFIVTISVLPESYQFLLNEKQTYPFRPGMSATVEILTERAQDVIAVPVQAVTTRAHSDSAHSDKEYEEVVFTVIDGEAQKTPVVTGIQDDHYIHIKEGLSEEETVVTGPYSAISRTLEDGRLVELDEE